MLQILANIQCRRHVYDVADWDRLLGRAAEIRHMFAISLGRVNLARVNQLIGQQCPVRLFS